MKPDDAATQSVNRSAMQTLIQLASRQDEALQKVQNSCEAILTIFETIYPRQEGDPPSEIQGLVDVIRDPRGGIPAARNLVAKLATTLKQHT